MVAQAVLDREYSHALRQNLLSTKTTIAVAGGVLDACKTKEVSKPSTVWDALSM